MKTIYPADTVDSLGKVYPTVGENIRNGAKNFNMDSLLELYSSIFNKKCVYDIVSFTGEKDLDISVDNPIYIGSSRNIALTKGIIIDYFILDITGNGYSSFNLYYGDKKFGIIVRNSNTNTVSGKILIIRTED